MPLVTSGTAVMPAAPIPVLAVLPGPSRKNHVSIVKLVVPVASVDPNETRSSTPSNFAAEADAGGGSAAEGRRSNRSSSGIAPRTRGSHVDALAAARAGRKPGAVAASADSAIDPTG